MTHFCFIFKAMDSLVPLCETWYQWLGARLLFQSPEVKAYDLAFHAAKAVEKFGGLATSLDSVIMATMEGDIAQVMLACVDSSALKEGNLRQNWMCFRSCTNCARRWTTSGFQLTSSTCCTTPKDSTTSDITLYSWVTKKKITRGSCSLDQVCWTVCVEKKTPP